LTFVDIFLISHILCLVAVCQPLIKLLLTYLLTESPHISAAALLPCRVVETLHYNAD